MILELDVGNSRIKWRLLDAITGSTTDMVSNSGIEELCAALSAIAPPQMVRMCSVRGDESHGAISQWIDAQWSLPVHQARVVQSCGGVRNQYEDQGRLGVDRWLAMLAAYKLAADACVIIDSGTALTIDVLDASGLHLGGFITPGLQIMRNSLEQNTRIRLSNQQSTNELALGNSTDSAVRNGTLSALISLIDRVVAQTRDAAAGAQVYFAGGDAALLAAHADITDFQITPYLVLDGLAIACPCADNVQTS